MSVLSDVRLLEKIYDFAVAGAKVKGRLLCVLISS
jgi:hypothetical protein